MPANLFRRSKIGEFTPLGFFLGFVLCFCFFWVVFHRLPFKTPPTPTPQAQTVSVGEFERLAAQLKADEATMAGLQQRVDSLTQELQRCGCKPRVPANCK